MAASSRDTAQLIRLVYASVCGERWGGVKQDGASSSAKEEKKMAFFPFKSFLFY